MNNPKAYIRHHAVPSQGPLGSIKDLLTGGPSGQDEGVQSRPQQVDDGHNESGSFVSRAVKLWEIISAYIIQQAITHHAMIYLLA